MVVPLIVYLDIHKQGFLSLMLVYEIFSVCSFRARFGRYVPKCYNILNIIQISIYLDL